MRPGRPPTEQQSRESEAGTPLGGERADQGIGLQPSPVSRGDRQALVAVRRSLVVLAGKPAAGQHRTTQSPRPRPCRHPALGDILHARQRRGPGRHGHPPSADGQKLVRAALRALESAGEEGPWPYVKAGVMLADIVRAGAVPDDCSRRPCARERSG